MRVLLEWWYSDKNCEIVFRSLLDNIINIIISQLYTEVWKSGLPRFILVISVAYFQSIRSKLMKKLHQPNVCHRTYITFKGISYVSKPPKSSFCHAKYLRRQITQYLFSVIWHEIKYYLFREETWHNLFRVNKHTSN